MKKAKLILNQAIKELGIQPNLKTDPKIIKKTLKEMKLGNFKTDYKPIKKFLEEIKKYPQPIKPTLENIKKGIIQKHPAILEFLEKALEKKWISKSKHIQTSIYITIILEHFTAAMANDIKFATEMQNYFSNIREKYGIKTSSSIQTLFKVKSITNSLFYAIKTISIDPGITYHKLKRTKNITLNKKYLKTLYKKKKINYLEYKINKSIIKKTSKLKHTGLRINIYEAGISEYKKGFEDNALCAHILAEELRIHPQIETFRKTNVIPENTSENFYKSLINPKNTFSSMNFGQDWASLYETWNMAFILHELNDLHILFPKLLIPSAINAKPNNYISTRGIALWLSINTILFNKLDKKKEVKGPKNKKEMAKTWGKINKKYAYIFAKKHIKMTKNNTDKSFKKMFSKPLYNLLKIFMEY